MIETIFFEQSQVGQPVFPGPSTLLDVEKLWLPNEYAGGLVRWGGEEFPILSNTGQQLTLEGDAASVLPDDVPFYQIVPPEVHSFTQLLQTEKFSFSSVFNQVPTSFPALTIRLEKDEQSDTYLGENLEHYAVDGIEFDIRSQGITGSYLISIWSVNRELAQWLYAWALHYALNSIPVFNSWGLYDVAFSGSDLDPQLQYLAERAYTRHFLVTATRIERAVTMRPVEWVSDVCLKVVAHYARRALTVPAMD